MTTVIKGKIVRSDQYIYDGIEETVSRRDSTGGTIVSIPIGDMVDVLGAYGNMEAYNRQTIERCTTAIGTKVRTLVFRPGTWTIDANTTIASNFTCLVLAGAVFSVDSGVTLTFSGPVIRHAQTWTSGSGTVTESGTRYMSGAFNFSGTVDFTGTVLQGATPLVFEGLTANAFETSFAITDPTADRTITFPDATGTVALTGGILDLSSTVLQGATPLVFEGATDNAFETSFAITDPTADRIITFPDNTGTVMFVDVAQTVTGDWTLDQNFIKWTDADGEVLHQIGA